MNQLPSELAAIVAVIDPDANAAGTITSAYVSVAKFRKLMAIVMAGDLGSSATLNFKLVQATSAAGAGKKDISGKAITALTEAGTDSNKQAIINFDQTDLDITNGFAFVAMEMVTAVATSDSGAIMLGFDAAINPASDNDASSVDEIVA